MRHPVSEYGDNIDEPKTPPETGRGAHALGLPSSGAFGLESGFGRRTLIQGGLAAGLGFLLSGCQSPGGYTRTAGPVWPDQEGAKGSSFPGGANSSSGSSGQARSASRARVPSNYYSTESGVVPRREWARGNPIRSLSNPMDGIYRLTIHHEGEPAVGLTNKSAVARRLESIRQWHIGRKNGWADIGYHYVIDPAGRVWEGRPLFLQGAHVKDHNEHNLGIMLLGDFNQHRPSSEQIATLCAFVPQQIRRYRIPLGRVYTHRELMPTACPGSSLQSYLVAARSRGGSIASSV